MRDRVGQFDTVLLFAGAFFACSRADPVIGLLPGDILIDELRATVELFKLKGRRPGSGHKIEFERLVGMRSPFRSFKGQFPCSCPVAVFS